MVDSDRRVSLHRMYNRSVHKLQLLKKYQLLADSRCNHLKQPQNGSSLATPRCCRCNIFGLAGTDDVGRAFPGIWTLRSNVY